MSNLDDLTDSIKNSEKTLFILCGFPYAGKSYVATQLLKHTDVMSVSIDSIFHAHGFDWNTNVLPNEKEWQQIFDESYKKVKEALRQGKNVLYDSTNQTLESRDKLREVARSVGADTCVVYIKSSAETIWERWEDNRKNPTRSLVNRELVQMTVDMFEEPMESENVIVINN